MTLRRDPSGTIVLEGSCPVEDAEPLLRMLQQTPDAALDWTGCRHLHTAVLQIILAARPRRTGPCGDPFTDQALSE
jgi:hypothetical protein